MTGWRKVKTIFVICAAVGWWGIWFPELAVWTEAVCVVQEDGLQKSEENIVNCESVYKGFMQADKSQIKIKSRLGEWFYAYFDGN